MKLHFDQAMDLNKLKGSDLKNARKRAEKITDDVLVSDKMMPATVLTYHTLARYLERGEIVASLGHLQESLLQESLLGPKLMTTEDFEHGRGSPAFVQLEKTLRKRFSEIMAVVCVPAKTQEGKVVPAMMALLEPEPSPENQDEMEKINPGLKAELACWSLTCF